jgi:hypothetical protein
MDAGLNMISETSDKPLHALSPMQLLIRYLFQNPVFQSLFLFLLFFVVYSELPLPIGGGKIIPGFLLVPFLMIIWPFIRNDIRLKHLYFVMGVGGVALVSCLFHFSAAEPASLVFRLLQFFYSLVSGVLITLFVVKMPVHVFRNVCFFFVLFIVLGCLLERAGIIGPIVNAFHNLYANTDYFAEVDEFRDLTVTGFVRPLFFTSEPSMVGFGYFAFASGFVILSNSIRLDVIVLISTLLLLVIVGSPTVILTLLFLFILFILKLKIPVKYVLIVPAGLFLFIFFVAQLPVVNELVSTLIFRFSDELFEEGTSIYARIYVPYFKTLPVIVQKAPLFGAGYGNHSILNSYLGYKGELDEFEAQFIRGANAFVNYINYLGFLGTFLVMLFIRQFARLFNKSTWMLVIVFWFLQNQMVGTFATPRSWACLCIIIAAFGLAEIQKQQGKTLYR